MRNGTAILAAHLPNAFHMGQVSALASWWITDTADEPYLRRLAKFGPKDVSLVYAPAAVASPRDLPAKKAILEAAATCCDLVEIMEQDLSEELLAAIPPEKRIMAWYGKASSLADLEKRLTTLQRTPARYYKIVPFPFRSGEELWPLQLLKKHNADNLIAYADGPLGYWTQLVALHLGCPVIAGSVGAATVEHLSLDQLITDYDLPQLRIFERLYGIAGNPVVTSLSPRLHNAAYRQLGLPCWYLPFHLESFTDFYHEVLRNPALADLGISIEGLTVVSPFKENGYHLADPVHPMVLQSHAGNLWTQTNGQWQCGSTDASGIQRALSEWEIEVVGKKAVVVGCGGAGRTLAATLNHMGAEVTLVNRSEARAQNAGLSLHLPYRLLNEFDFSCTELVINATPVGKQPEELPFDPRQLPAGAVVVDMAYANHVTELVHQSDLLGLTVIDGRDTLRIQVQDQFKAMTGVDMPSELAERLSALPEPNTTTQERTN